MRSTLNWIKTTYESGLGLIQIWIGLTECALSKVQCGRDQYTSNLVHCTLGSLVWTGINSQQSNKIFVLWHLHDFCNVIFVMWLFLCCDASQDFSVVMPPCDLLWLVHITYLICTNHNRHHMAYSLLAAIAVYRIHSVCRTPHSAISLCMINSCYSPIFRKSAKFS